METMTLFNTRPLVMPLVLAQVLMMGSAASAAVVPVPPAAFQLVDVPATKAFGASPEDLSKYGYVEQEYYVTGAANRYRFGAPLADAQVVDGGHRYKTRILVRRPKDPAKFNGTVLVEWYNVTVGQDVDFNYAAAHEYMLSNGYAIVAVSAQVVGVATLKKWSAARYGDLSLDAPPVEPTPPPGRFTANDVLAWDVFSQTIQGLRTPAGANPLAGLTVKRVIANGESQSASLLTRYYNSIDPLHRVVDGFVYYDGAGQLRTDSPVKAITVGTEVFGADPGSPQSDSPTFRRWEVAGASHIGLYDIQYADTISARDGALRGENGRPSDISGLITNCAWTPLWSSVPVHYVVTSAFAHMNQWIQGGAAPSSAPRFARDTSVTPAVVRRDDKGEVIGGIRLSEFTYPTQMNKGRGNNGDNFFCFIAGTHLPYSAQQLAARYPDREKYLADVQKLNASNAASGFILPGDAAKSTANARIAMPARVAAPVRKARR
jgi:hypothetical protein